MFEQSVGAGRGESQHIQGIFVVSLAWVHLYNVMSHIDCLSRRTCDEFRCGSCNIIYKSPTLTRNRKDSVCCSPTEQSPVDSRSNCQTQKHLVAGFLGLWNFSIKNRSPKEIDRRDYMLWYKIRTVIQLVFWWQSFVMSKNILSVLGFRNGIASFLLGDMLGKSQSLSTMWLGMP